MEKLRSRTGIEQIAGAWAERLASPALEYLPLWLGGAALVVYLFTMAPDLSWGHSFLGRPVGFDGGDFVTAAWFMGVPHPTGYPTYTALAWLFTRLPLGSVAWRVNLLSGVAGAATVALLALVGRALARTRRGSRLASASGAAVGALLLGWALLFWGHSLITEVYTLLAFFIALVLWLMMRWHRGRGPLWPAALAFGLGMGNHITLAFVGPVILGLLWSGRERLSRRGVLGAALALGAGLLVYLYLPWRAASDPLINWGDPDSWEGFRWVITGRGYRRFFFALPAEEWLPRLADWWTLTRVQFPYLAWPLAALGLWEMARHDRWLALGSVAHALVNLLYSLGYDTTDAFVHLLPVYFYLALWMGQGTAALLAATQKLFGAERDTRRVAHLVAAGLLLLPIASLIQGWDVMDLSDAHATRDYAQEALQVVEPGALILVGSDVHTFALWYYRYVEKLRPDVAVANYAMLAFDWYRDTIATAHPEVALPGPSASRVTKLDLVLRNLDTRPVYIAEDEGLLTGLELTPAGRLWRVTAP